VPPWKGKEKEEAYEGEDYSDDAGDLLMCALDLCEMKYAYIKYGKTI
jgi:hypothetical protein